MSDYNSPTLLWHDYEAWGANPTKDHPSQFAAIRTDMDLNEIDEPVNWLCQIPNDYLPHPIACLITGITPQKSLRDGITEAEFMAKVHSELAKPNTCTVGYNSIRFDDEVTRHSLYRNFYDPYAREWQNGNSRWDIIDLVRATYALRPDGINWVYKDSGEPSFKLEDLAQANGILHESAHDALSDVRATIGLAKLIKQHQPKLFDFFFSLRKKDAVWQQMNLEQLVPLIHVSSKLPSIQGCCTWVVPVIQHPTNKNAVVALNLQLDPSPLLHLSVEELNEKLYQKSSDLVPGEKRLPIKQIHVNKCPFVAMAKSLSAENAERLDIDREQCLENLKFIQNNAQTIADKLYQLSSIPFKHDEQDTVDCDHALYSGGFISNQDRLTCQMVLASQPEQLAALSNEFSDTRLAKLLFRYRARNFPNTLNSEEIQRWQAHRFSRLHDESSNASIGFSEYGLELERLVDEYQHNPAKISLLKDLYLYAEQL